MRIRSRHLNKFVIRIAVVLLRLLFRTCRVRVLPQGAVWTKGYFDNSPPEFFLYSIWHDLMLFPIFGKRSNHMATLVSRHEDGSVLATAMQILGIGAVRGSTSRGGATAVRELMNVAKEYHICITPDGPRGPRRKMKSGIVFLASHTGRAIIPTAYAASRWWSIKGRWTDMRIPKPFSKVILLGGDPIRVPPNLSRDQIENYTALVEQQMRHAQETAEQLAKGGDLEAPAEKIAA